MLDNRCRNPVKSCTKWCTVQCVLCLGSMSTLLDPLDDLPPGIAQYEDYHTIDWQREIARDRMRHRFIVGRWRAGRLFEKLKSAHDAWSGWICVLLVGCVAGIDLVVFLLWLDLRSS